MRLLYGICTDESMVPRQEWDYCSTGYARFGGRKRTTGSLNFDKIAARFGLMSPVE
ncbi:MAG: hypothetical protein LBG99_04305 [Propionibacteriaceae bacterium]|nr:hypothetical protein [Propionibacteriaceae bacterium]